LVTGFRYGLLIIMIQRVADNVIMELPEDRVTGEVMNKKRLVFACFIVLLLAWTEPCLAGQAYFQTTGLWRVAGNWATWNGAQLPPSAADWANLNNGNVCCTIDSSTAAVCVKLTLPDWQNYQPNTCYLDMTGGTLQIGGNFEIGNYNSTVLDRGEFNISCGTVTASGDFYVGRDGIGTVNMSGGTITISGTLYVPKNSGGTGKLNLDGGTINAGSLSMNAGGQIDINNGTLILSGDKRETVNPYVASGWITAYNNTGSVVLDYNSVTNRTKITGTTDYFLIDNFESYTDAANLRASWHDSSNGGANATVNLETRMIHGGSKSMSCAYNNSGATHYSEIYYQYASAQDWSGSTKVLGVFFHGSKNNAPERMYVVLKDVNDVNATVAYGGDANDIIQQEEEWWNVWNIKLRDFNDGSVNLSKIERIIIGFGDKNNLQPGGTGTVYFDDIRLSVLPYAGDCNYIPFSDFSGDARINFCDYAKLADAWQAEANEPQFYGIYDLDGNGVVNFKDLTIFADNWLWPPEQVLITVDAGTVKGDISFKITGTNTSWYYDNDAIWADGNMAGYLKDWGVGMLRYPGGCETSKFHWEIPYGYWNVDLWEPGSSYTLTSAYMNIDDYIAKCRAVGAEPLIGVNIQSGKKYNRIQDSINEAVRWVQYCKDHNYNVRYWYLDNEPYYQYNSEAMTAVEYAGYIVQFAPAMKAVDPNIKIIVNWENKLSITSYWNAWETLFETAGAYFDIADVHWYWAWGYATWDMWLGENPMKVREWCGDCIDSKYIGPSYADEIKGFYDKIKNINGVSYDCKLAALEWNIAPTYDNRFSRFQHALMQAEMIGQFIEGGLEMACIWPLTWDGTLGGDFRTVLDDTAHQPTPSSWVFKLYSHALGQKLITSTTSLAHVRPVSVLSNDGNTMWIYLLNKSGEGDAVRAQVDVNAFTPAKAEAIAFTALTLSSDVGRPKKIIVGVNGNGQWECVLPPHSLTMLTFHKNN